MYKETEILLEKYKIICLVVVKDSSAFDDNEAKQYLVERNGYCAILKVPEEEKINYPFEYIAGITVSEFNKLTIQKTLVNLTSLNISSNELTNLPTELWQLTNLTSLNISYNKLTSLPAELGQLTNLKELIIEGGWSEETQTLLSIPQSIGQLTNLTSLNVSRHKLTKLPIELGHLTNLTSLDISNNELTSLPAEIGKLSNLTTLNISSNKLTKLSIELGQLTNLNSLNISNNELTSLPAEIGKLSNLTTLNISSNKLTKLSIELGHLTNLTSLDISNNELISLPAEIGQLTNLTSLDIFNNELTSLPTELWQLTNLTSLNISGTKLTSLPAEIGKLTSLISLDISSNELTSLPTELWQLTDLTSLNISSTKLTSLPAEIGKLTNLKTLQIEGGWSRETQILLSIPESIGQLTNLTSLNISRNKLTALPVEIGQLTSLTVLDISSNKLTSLPAEIGQLTSLTVLDISSNKLTSLPAELGQLTNLKRLQVEGGWSEETQTLLSIPQSIGQLTNLTSLNVSRHKLTKLPIELGHLTNLTSLDISNNELTSLPAEIGKLSNLTTLNISSNKLTKLSIELGQLTNLNSLNISNNELTSLPAEIGKLSNLTTLNISSNKLTKLSIELGHLTNLTSLDISNNELISLPAEIGQLTNLTSLDIFNNELTSLPTELWQLTNLTSLDLRNNQLISLPVELKRLAKLERLLLQENKIEFPPEILDKYNDAQAIISYQAWILGGKRKQICETKILVVGQGSVGKTSLVKRTIVATFNPHEIKTDGIAIDHWHVDNKIKADNSPSEIALHIWDFGGQEIMHATHQFFLTKRSLYILVLDSRLTQEENRTEYWLKIIQSFGGESPVLIVGNKIDQHPLDIDRTGLQKKYPNIVGILETSAATGAGIEALKAAIAEQVNNLPHVRDLLPETWFTVKTKLEELGKQSNFITHDKYLELCAENEVSDETSQRTLIGFLHDLGVVLHFQDDPRLEALGILNPQWVTNGVYKILNSHALFQNKGVLTVSMLDEILNLPEYPRGKRLFIVDMMKKFELCYDIEPDKTFLVPDLLPKDEPVMDGQENALAFQYHYTVLPSSVITRFIVRMNEFIDEKIWRTGAVLKDGGNTAVVKADIEDRKVYILVSGDKHKRHDFLSKIRGQFDAIHKTISKLEMKEMVPVPNHPEAEPVDYDLLLQMDHNNVEVYPVLSGGRMIVVNVREMLNGVARDSDRQRGNTTNIYVGGDVHADTFIAGNENQATVSKSDKKPKKKKP